MTDVDLVTSSQDDASAPLLVVDNGRTYSIAGEGPKRSIMGLIAKNAMEMRTRGSHHGEKLIIVSLWLDARITREIKTVNTTCPEGQKSENCC